MQLVHIVEVKTITVLVSAMVGGVTQEDHTKAEDNFTRTMGKFKKIM